MLDDNQDFLHFSAFGVDYLDINYDTIDSLSIFLNQSDPSSMPISLVFGVWNSHVRSLADMAADSSDFILGNSYQCKSKGSEGTLVLTEQQRYTYTELLGCDGLGEEINTRYAETCEKFKSKKKCNGEGDGYPAFAQELLTSLYQTCAFPRK